MRTEVAMAVTTDPVRHQGVTRQTITLAVGAGPSADPVMAATLAELWRSRCAATPRSLAYQWFDAEASDWIGITWVDAGERVTQWAQALDAEHLEHGARVAILVPNSIDHVVMDQAVLARGCVPVPMHAVDNPESLAHILQDSDASILFIDTRAHWRTLAAAGGPFKSLKRIIYLRSVPEDHSSDDATVVSLGDWLSGGQPRTPHDNPVVVAPDDLAAIVYTSGTTGRPKGVMLTHANVMANVRALRKCLAAVPDDIFLSFLPLSHAFERTVGYTYPIAMGASVAFARSARDLPADLRAVRPTILTSVPRIYERFYAGIMERQRDASWLSRLMFDAAQRIGNRRFEARQRRAPPLSLFEQLAWPLAKRLVADRILDQFGGHLRVAISGGAPIAEPVIRMFLAAGLDVLQGYGMTETSPVVATNVPDDNDPRSVGRALVGVEVRIGDNEELLVRGANVMRGYWRKPEETARVIEHDGWLHTGDQARIVDGRITISGRIKDIIVTATGEKFPPVDLETAITADPLFEQALIIGEKRPFVAALVVLNAAVWESVRSSTTGQSDVDILLARIATAARGFPIYAVPRAVSWSTKPWTVENGLVTPTLKVRRLAVEHTFAADIEQLYRPLPERQSDRAPGKHSLWREL
jgi:long-chain acyl-CoA synthetase